jgi:hypothetical protein
VKVDALDNPGWRVTIELAGTDLDGRPLETRERGVKDEVSTDWYFFSSPSRLRSS